MTPRRPGAGGCRPDGKRVRLPSWPRPAQQLAPRLSDPSRGRRHSFLSRRWRMALLQGGALGQDVQLAVLGQPLHLDRLANRAPGQTLAPAESNAPWGCRPGSAPAPRPRASPPMSPRSECPGPFERSGHTGLDLRQKLRQRRLALVLPAMGQRKPFHDQGDHHLHAVRALVSAIAELALARGVAPKCRSYNKTSNRASPSPSVRAETRRTPVPSSYQNDTDDPRRFSKWRCACRCRRLGDQLVAHLRLARPANACPAGSATAAEPRTDPARSQSVNASQHAPHCLARCTEVEVDPNRLAVQFRRFAIIGKKRGPVPNRPATPRWTGTTPPAGRGSHPNTDAEPPVRLRAPVAVLFAVFDVSWRARAP